MLGTILDKGCWADLSDKTIKQASEYITTYVAEYVSRKGTRLQNSLLTKNPLFVMSASVL